MKVKLYPDASGCLPLEVETLYIEVDGMKFSPEILAALGKEPDAKFSFRRAGDRLLATRLP